MRIQEKRYIREPARKIPVIAAADVVVCGGGPSGMMAAIAAARNGAKVILLEQYGFLGGMATIALVGPISKFNVNGERIVGGIPEEFIKNVHQKGGAVINLPSGNIPYDPEIYKYVAMKMVQAARVDILLHTTVAGCMSYGEHPHQITHLLIENKSGRQAIQTNYVIDCTGTGDVVARTSLPWIMRTNAQGELQPMSLYFRLGGVDTSSLDLLMAEDEVKYRNQELNALLQEEVAAGRLGNFGGPWVVHGSTLRQGEVSVNATRFKGNAANGHDLSAAALQLRDDVMKILGVFKEKSPAFKNAYLIDTAPQVGIRETRAIIGLYTMEAKDVLTPQRFPDTVAKGGHPVDIHRAENSGQDVRFLKEAYDIPYRAQVSKGTYNLLVAGGCISATREAYASVRVQAQCMALGEAAGTAAALCKRENISVAALDGTLLRETLKAAGAIV